MPYNVRKKMRRLEGIASSCSMVLLAVLVNGCAFDASRTVSETGGTGSSTGSSGGTLGSAGGGGHSTAGASGTNGADGGAGNAGTAGITGAAGNGGATASGSGGNSGTPPCDPNGPACNNCKDDDGDGLIDAADPECIGPFDNDEGTFATGIPGDNLDPCKQDCFFDGNSGAGDDGCDWNLKCDPASPGSSLPKSCPYDANYHNCPTTQSQMCLTTCRTVTPNGCDCFGCCLVPGAPNPIYLAPTCTAADFNDPTKCPPCTQVPSCINTCEHCEICVGKPTLPPDCSVGGTGGAGGGGGSTGAGGGGGSGAGGSPGSPCPAGETYCGPGGIDPLNCPTSTYCITGCCIPTIG
jgi:hypothetical protein